MNEKTKKGLFLTLAIIFIVYYIICIIFAWAGVSWLWVWPLASLFCLVRFFMIKKKLSVPKWLKVIYRIALSVFLIAFFSIETLIVSAMSEKPKDNLDYIIVLGAAVRNGIPTTPMSLRMTTALDYLKSNPDTICIASGGQGENEIIAEGDCIADFLDANGIDVSRIIRETKSTDTEENLEFSFRYISDNSSVGIVTNSFHIFRAESVARLMGHSVSGVPAPTYPILGIHYTVREFFAMVELYIKALLSSKLPVPYTI